MQNPYVFFFLPSKKTPYEKCSHTIADAIRLVQNGTIVLISGTSATSHCVTFFCASKYSHIGIIYRHPEHNYRPFLFESVRHNDDTTSPAFAIPSNDATGVKLTD